MTIGYFPGDYWAAAYWPGDYFAGSGPVVAPAGPPPTDEEILADVVSILTATGAFGQVIANSPEVSAEGDPYPLCIVVDPGTSTEVDWTTGGVQRHDGEFLITLVAPEIVPGDAYGTINRLERVVRDELGGVALGGVTWPWATSVDRELTGYRAASFLGVKRPEPDVTLRHSYLVLTFAYEVTAGEREPAPAPPPPIPPPQSPELGIVGYGGGGYGDGGYGLPADPDAPSPEPAPAGYGGPTGYGLIGYGG
jgi:hypothetical protein